MNGSETPVTVPPGAAVTVEVSGGPGLPRDWVGKYLSTALNGAHFTDWAYLNGSKTPPAVGVTSATLTFTMAAAGTYNFRLFRNNAYVVLATSPDVIVAGAPTATPPPTPTPTPGASPTILVDGGSEPITVLPGATVTVDVSGGPGLMRDWVAKYTAGAPNTAYFPDWVYLNGLRVAPTVARTSATLTFTMPSIPGTYEFRFLRNNSYVLLATSPTVRVAPQLRSRRWRAASKRMMPAATATLRLSTCPAMGTDTRPEHACTTSGGRPAPSLPTTSADGRRQSTAS